MVAYAKDSTETFGEERLINELKKGKELAMKIIWDAYSKDLYYISFAITGNMQESKDIVSDGFIKLWEKRQDFDDMTKVKHFLRTIVRNESLNHYNKIKRQEKTHQEIMDHSSDHEDPITTDLNKAEMLGLFSEVLGLLSSQQQKIIKATLIEGATGKEVAEKLMIHEATLYREKERALGIMKEFAERNRWKYPSLLPYLLTLYDLAKHSLN